MKKKKIGWIFLSILIGISTYGCGLTKTEDKTDWENEMLDMPQQDVSLEEDTNTNADNTIAQDKDGETTEYEYPIILTPTLTNNISFAIESEDILCVNNGEKYGYITKSGIEITDYIYDMAYPFSEGVACVLLDGKYGFIDANGEEAIPFIYDDAASFSDGLAYFSTENEYGFLNKDGTVAFYLDCDSVSSFSEGLAYFSLDGRYGYINKTGKCVIEPSFSDADYFKNGVAIVMVDGNLGAINSKGEIVIPLEYRYVYRSSACSYMYAAKEDYGTYDYFDFDGTKITYEEAESRGSAYRDKMNKTSEIILDEDEEGAIFYDERGTEILHIDCDYVGEYIYGNSNNALLLNYGSSETDSIALVEEQVDVDLSAVILKNSITPRKKLYWDLFFNEDATLINFDSEVVNLNEFGYFTEWDYIKCAKLYDVDNSGNPYLFCKEKPITSYNFPMSESAIYGIYSENLYIINTGYECGGSARGDYVCLYKHIETGETFVGVSGAFGGFGGYSNCDSVCQFKDGKAECVASWEWIGQDASNYSEDELIEDAELFYDEDGIPYTKETIVDEEYIEEYNVNGQRVAKEVYDETTDLYTQFSLLGF